MAITEDRDGWWGELTRQGTGSWTSPRGREPLTRTMEWGPFVEKQGMRNRKGNTIKTRMKNETEIRGQPGMGL